MTNIQEINEIHRSRLEGETFTKPYKLLISQFESAPYKTLHVKNSTFEGLLYLCNEYISVKRIDWYANGENTADLYKLLMGFTTVLVLYEQLLQDGVLTQDSSAILKILPNLLKLRNIIELPKSLEKITNSIDEARLASISVAPVCDICGLRGADFCTSNISAHRECIISDQWAMCLNCNWYYPPQVEVCSRSPECKRCKLVAVFSEHNLVN